MVPPQPHSATRSVFETDLTQTPLPEMLVTIYRHKVPGTIECRRGTELKEIFLDHGHIIFATSNQVRDSLGNRLLNEGLITREQYEESVRRLLATGRRQGTILTEMKVLDAERMLAAVREQIQEIVWSIFAWDGGTASFTPGRERHQEFVKLDIPIPQAIVEGVRHMPDPKTMLSRVGTKTTIVVRSADCVDEMALDEDEQNLLAMADGRHSLSDIVNTPPLSAGVNARLLYAFFVMQLVTVKDNRGVRVKVQTNAGGRTAQ